MCQITILPNDDFLFQLILSCLRWTFSRLGLRLFLRLCQQKVKRRVVRRAFYSSEEDESTEEEFEEHDQSINTPEVTIFTSHLARQLLSHTCASCNSLRVFGLSDGDDVLLDFLILLEIRTPQPE